jgi:hypothetical protein
MAAPSALPAGEDPRGWSDVPDHILEKVLLSGGRGGGGKTCAAASAVCKSWKRAADQEFLWQSFAVREFGLTRNLAALALRMARNLSSQGAATAQLERRERCVHRMAALPHLMD